MTASTATIALLSSCSFLGNFGAALTGFGEAIIFLFCWQVVDLLGYDDGDFKSAIFIQSLSLFSVQPFLLWETSVIKYAHRRILLLFVPITLIFTPVGQYVGGIAPIPLMKKVAGVVVLMVAFIETHSRRHRITHVCLKKEKSVEGGVNTTADIQMSAEVGKLDPRDLNMESTSFNSPIPAAMSTSLRLSLTRRSSNFAKKATPGTNVDHDQEDASEPERAADENYSTAPAPIDDPVQSNESVSPQSTIPPAEKINYSCRVISDTVIAGGLSGFLGGMIGIRTPPLMLYFMHPPAPLVFDNHSQRATGVVIMCTSTVFRQMFYLHGTFKPPGDVPGYQNEFVGYQQEDWRLYLCVVVFSILGGFVGGKAFEYVKDAKETIRWMFLILLYMCGVSLFISAYT